jgi:hypothetical protein
LALLVMGESFVALDAFLEEKREKAIVV